MWPPRWMKLKQQNESNGGLTVIKTARTAEEINSAARKGVFPLVKLVQPSEQIRSKFAVMQNQKTGEIEVIGDYRALSDLDSNSDYEMVIDFTFVYPLSVPSPFAAYLVPKDLAVGERVLLEDLIEDYVGASWNQGDVYRLEACEAIWNGDDFDIQYSAAERSDFVG
ncbi:MAG TPA: hypothetical protein EYN03_08985 [Planctomycetes bacterium]|nr:hypothetical protein [Planctomycetaceae bacterium]HIN95767.1 hypothetical protein [Planctomycetota bacterium]